MNPRYITSLSSDGDLSYAILELTPSLKKHLRKTRKAYKAAAKVLGNDVSLSTYDTSVYWLQSLPDSMQEPEELNVWLPLEEGPLEALASAHDPETRGLSDLLLPHGVRTTLEQLHVLKPTWLYFSCKQKYQDETVETPQLSKAMLTWLDALRNNRNTTPGD